MLMGGESVTPASVEAQLRAAGFVGEVIRISGDDRYGTSIEMAKWAAQNGSDISSPVVASGQEAADALAGAALAGKKGSVLLLANDKTKTGKPRATPAVDFLEERASEVGEGYILGLQSAVSDELERRIMEATDGVLVASSSPLSGQSADAETASGRQYTAAHIG